MAKMTRGGFRKPTPKKWVRIGNSLIVVSTTIMGFALYEQYKGVAISSMCIGVIGKFLTTFFEE